MTITNEFQTNESFDEDAAANKAVEVEQVKPVRTKLHVSNFPEHCTRRNLTEYFSQFGQVLECAIMWDKYAFIHYGTMAEAQYALKRSNGSYFMGKRLMAHLSTSRNRQSSNWYQQVAAKMEKELFDNTRNLNDSNSNGENNSLLSDSSGFLVETKLYVTNLPENCNQVELKVLFEKYGNVLECVIMWNHYAFVHFADLREAKIALKHLHGHSFNGKNLIVQLSTSSNRPLPKCLAFSGASKPGVINSYSSPVNEKLNGSIQENRKLPSILCYRANEASVVDKQQSSSFSKDWIKLLKTGNVPIHASQNGSSEITSESISYKSIKNENNGELVSLSGIPTPIQPDLTSKIPSSNKKIIQNSAQNNINNYGYLSLETVKNELKRISSAAFKMEPLLENELYKEEVSINNFNQINSNSSLNNRNFFNLNQIPTPPVPLADNLNKSGELCESENDLKRLIDSINNSKKLTTFSAFSDPTSNNLYLSKEKKATENSPTNPDVENEKLLIENLNKLKYENELITNLATSQQASSWANLGNSLESKLNFSSIDTTIPNGCISRMSSSSGFPSSISSSSATSSSSASPIIFSKCLNEKSENKFNYESLAERPPKSEPLKSKKQLTRCRVLNLLLFPELQS